MSELKLLIVEDNEGDLETCRSTAKRYMAAQHCKINLVECRTLQEALDEIDNSFDGAIIDLKLEADDEGNRVIDKIHKDYRIPIAILTGTPDNDKPDISYVGVCKKGETGYDNLFDNFYKIYNTGLTRIIGGRGQIEEAMNGIFWDNILPQLESWKSHAEKGKKTEKALLRFTLSHLLELLGNDSEFFLPEEMYIVPPVVKKLRTGSIVKKKDSADIYIVLSPACDLAIHGGGFKTDRILVCEIEGFDNSLIADSIKKSQAEIRDDDPERDKKREQRDKAELILKRLPNNSYCDYFHFLPKTSKFNGGIINFRKIHTFKPKNFHNQFDNPLVQISSAFIKDIVARFSSYYARQGQPDFNFAELVENLKLG